MQLLLRIRYLRRYNLKIEYAFIKIKKKLHINYLFLSLKQFFDKKSKNVVRAFNIK